MRDWPAEAAFEHRTYSKTIKVDFDENMSDDELEELMLAACIPGCTLHLPTGLYDRAVMLAARRSRA